VIVEQAHDRVVAAHPEPGAPSAVRRGGHGVRVRTPARKEDDEEGEER
jgi:hypothetical protein